MHLRIRMCLPWMLSLLPMVVGAAPPQHKLIVTFQYDFTIEQPYKENQTGNCVKRFIIYDITDPNAPVRLFSIAVDPRVKKIQYQVKARSDFLPISDGMHTLGATSALGQWGRVGSESVYHHRGGETAAGAIEHKDGAWRGKVNRRFQIRVANGHICTTKVC